MISFSFSKNYFENLLLKKVNMNFYEENLIEIYLLKSNYLMNKKKMKILSKYLCNKKEK